MNSFMVVLCRWRSHKDYIITAVSTEINELNLDLKLIENLETQQREIRKDSNESFCGIMHLKLIYLILNIYNSFKSLFYIQSIFIQFE